MVFDRKLTIFVTMLVLIGKVKGGMVPRVKRIIIIK